MNGRGFWSFYILCIAMFHLIMLSVPIDAFSVKWVWTVTNLAHNVISFGFLHWTKSTPWLSCDQGSVRRLTHWEQIDHGMQYTPTRKFLTIIPILLYFLASFYTNYDQLHFILNTISLGFVLVPKHPTFHKVRLFGINKYQLSSHNPVYRENKLYLSIMHFKSSQFDGVLNKRYISLNYCDRRCINYILYTFRN